MSARRPQDYDLFRLIAINAYAAYYNSLVGNPAPRVREQYERSTNPQPGDLVLETSTVWRSARYAVEAQRDQYPNLGIFLREAMEPVVTGDQLAAMHADGDYYVRADETIDEVPKERVYYIEPLDRSVAEYRWTNASFIRVFDSLDAAIGQEQKATA